jgi:protein-S-isoprenylcysteine O-methyltransferase Ste14
MKALELKIPPVVVALVIGAGMWLLAGFFPDFSFYMPLKKVIASVLSIFGGIIAIAGIISFGQAKTTVNPVQVSAASSLVVTGVFAFTRNPMYLGLVFVLLGWFIYLSNIISLFVIPLFVLYMNQFQIKPEERALEAKFGQEFTTYKAKVRRWL